MKKSPVKEKNILIIEDEPSLSTILKDKLSREGFGVVTVDNGEDGLAFLKEHCVDLIMLDLILPGIPGEQVLKTIKGSKKNSKIPVIVLSAKGNEANIDNCLEVLGADEYLTKSDISLSGIVAKIKSFLV